MCPHLSLHSVLVYKMTYLCYLCTGHPEASPTALLSPRDLTERQDCIKFDESLQFVMWFREWKDGNFNNYTHTHIYLFFYFFKLRKYIPKPKGMAVAQELQQSVLGTDTEPKLAAWSPAVCVVCTPREPMSSWFDSFLTCRLQHVFI